MVYRNVEEGGEKIPCHHDLLAADFVGEAPEENEQRCSQNQCDGHDYVRRHQRDLEHRLEVEKRVELPGIPDDSLPRRRTEQDNEKNLPARPGSETFLNRRLRGLAALLEDAEQRRLAEAHADIVGDADEQERENKGNPPAPHLECLLAHYRAHDEDHGQRHEESERCRSLNEAGVKSAATVRCVLGDVHRRASVLSTKRKALEQTQDDEDDWCSQPDFRITWQESDGRRRAAHYQQGREKREFSSDEVADTAEHQRTERSNRKSDSESRQGLKEGSGWAATRKKLRRYDRGQASENIEVVPLDHRADRRCGNHLPDPLRIVERVGIRPTRRNGFRISGAHFTLFLDSSSCPIIESSRDSDTRSWRIPRKATLERRADDHRRCFPRRVPSRALQPVRTRP